MSHPDCLSDDGGSGCEDELREYEKVMQKYEGDLRNHIKIEQ